MTVDDRLEVHVAGLSDGRMRRTRVVRGLEMQDVGEECGQFL